MYAGYHVDVKAEGLLANYLHKLKNMNVVTNVGIINGATYADGTSVAYVGYLNEYGGHNPERPFLRRTMEKRYKAWTKLIYVTLKSEGLSGASVQKAFDRAGIMAVGDVKKTIKGWSPTDPRPNHPATIRAKARRGRSGKNLQAIDPNVVLIDTGIMIRSITHEVRHI